MSLKKAIKYGKEHRKEYRGAKSVDPMCRNHKGCDWCKGNRTYQSRKQIQKTNEEIAIFTRWQDPTIERLQQRIDKAIEYIENEETYEEGYCDGRLMIYKDRLEYELLNILRGEDNE